MKWSEKTDKLLLSLAQVQASVSPVTKNSVNPHFKSHYADLNAVWGVLSPLLADLGLVVVQAGAIRDGKPVLVTRVSESESGQWVEGELPLDGGKTDPQGIGAAITYQRRYSLCAMFGLMLEDDDGNAARPRPQPERQNTPPNAQKPAQNRPVQSNRPAAPQNAQGWPENHLAIVKLRKKDEGGPLKVVVGNLAEHEAEDALKTAIWRLNNIQPGKYAEKNRSEAQADREALEAYIQKISGVGFGKDEPYNDYATSIDGPDEPPF